MNALSITNSAVSLVAPQFAPATPSTSAMMTIRCEPRRCDRSLSQSFHIIRTKPRRVLVILGSSGNAYIIIIKNKSIHCSCPDHVSSCKHILFLATACGFLNRRSTTVSLSSAALLQRLHSPSPTPLLQAAILDPHTAKLCSVHEYPPCVHCAKHPNSHSAATFIICSVCGFLAHQQCFDAFQATLATGSSNQNHCISLRDPPSSTFPCPQCNKQCHLLSSQLISGYRNFYTILLHKGYQCHPPPSLLNPSSTLHCRKRLAPANESIERPVFPITDHSNANGEIVSPLVDL